MAFDLNFICTTLNFKELSSINVTFEIQLVEMFNQRYSWTAVHMNDIYASLKGEQKGK